jgi:hypothetical protein
MCPSALKQQLSGHFNVASMNSPTYDFKSIPARDLNFGSQARQLNIASTEVAMHTSYSPGPTDGTIVVTCHECGSGPFVGETAPQCVGCGHAWNGCPYCSTEEV